MQQLRVIRGRDDHAPFALPPGRPGDWSEFVEIPSLDVSATTAAAKRLNVAPDLLAAILVERALLLRDLGDRAPLVAPALDAEAGLLRPTPGPGAPLQSYVRDLKGDGNPRTRTQSDSAVAIPLRLHAGIRDLATEELYAGHAPQALRWEIAAASQARLMREWGLHIAYTRSLRTLRDAADAQPPRHASPR